MAKAAEKLERAVPLHQKNFLYEAEKIYREILRDDPGHADTLHLLGLIKHQQGMHEGALRSVDQAILASPNIPEYHVNRARILRILGCGEMAAEAASTALAIKPDNAEAFCELAGALLEIQNWSEALIAAKQAYRLAPDLIEVRKNLALAHFGLGSLHQDTQNYCMAEEHYRVALQFEPDLIEALVNLGNILRLLYRLEEALEYYERAISLAPELPEVHGNKGVILQETGDTYAAIKAYDISLQLDPKNAEFHRNRAQALLKAGRFKEGWPEFEWRWKTRHFAPIHRRWQSPQWSGQQLNGEVVLVHAEQGYGDSFQFVRYLPLLAEIGARVIVECPADLAGLISTVKGVEQVVSVGEVLPQHDFQVPMLSLPGAFKTNFDNIPASVPYITVPDSSQMKWQNRLGMDDKRFRIGVVWKGSAKHQRNEWRSPGLENFKLLLQMDEFRWFSLQKDDEANDLASVNFGNEIMALGHELEDFTDTAAAILNLDLIISPDTAVAHLAGALAKPVWLILPYASEWRWFERRADCPWYPTMKLFHQHVLGDWAGAVATIATQLEGRAFRLEARD